MSSQSSFSTLDLDSLLVGPHAYLYVIGVSLAEEHILKQIREKECSYKCECVLAIFAIN